MARFRDLILVGVVALGVAGALLVRKFRSAAAAESFYIIVVGTRHICICAGGSGSKEEKVAFRVLSFVSIL